jgi:hypothetical protein
VCLLPSMTCKDAINSDKTETGIPKISHKVER